MSHNATGLPTPNRARKRAGEVPAVPSSLRVYLNASLRKKKSCPVINARYPAGFRGRLRPFYYHLTVVVTEMLELSQAHCAMGREVGQPFSSVE